MHRIEFGQLLKVVDQLPSLKKSILREKLSDVEPLSWKKRLKRVLDYLGEKNTNYNFNQVRRDVTKAIREVR